MIRFEATLLRYIKTKSLSLYFESNSRFRARLCRLWQESSLDHWAFAIHKFIWIPFWTSRRVYSWSHASWPHGLQTCRHSYPFAPGPREIMQCGVPLLPKGTTSRHTDRYRPRVLTSILIPSPTTYLWANSSLIYVIDSSIKQGWIKKRAIYAPVVCICTFMENYKGILYTYAHIELCLQYTHACAHTYLLLSISMPWHRQAIFESKGDKLSSSAECRIRTQRVSETQSPADWMSADKCTCMHVYNYSNYQSTHSIIKDQTACTIYCKEVNDGRCVSKNFPSQII